MAFTVDLSKFRFPKDKTAGVAGHRVLITDSRKLRYQVPDTRALDAGSRRILERYL